MRKKIHYEENPFGEVKLGKQISLPRLPSPKELCYAEEQTKITLSVSKGSLSFFKEQAKKFNIPYQVMIRRLLDHYSSVIK